MQFCLISFFLLISIFFFVHSFLSYFIKYGKGSVIQWPVGIFLFRHLNLHQNDWLVDFSETERPGDITYVLSQVMLTFQFTFLTVMLTVLLPEVFDLSHCSVFWSTDHGFVTLSIDCFITSMWDAPFEKTSLLIFWHIWWNAMSYPGINLYTPLVQKIAKKKIDSIYYISDTSMICEKGLLCTWGKCLWMFRYNCV